LDYETFEAFNLALAPSVITESWVSHPTCRRRYETRLTDFIQGHSYCVKAMHFSQPGIVKNCNKWDMANTTNCKLLTNTLFDMASSLPKLPWLEKSVPDF
jgi:hypothetical protein